VGETIHRCAELLATCRPQQPDRRVQGWRGLPHGQGRDLLIAPPRGTGRLRDQDGVSTRGRDCFPFYLWKGSAVITVRDFNLIGTARTGHLQRQLGARGQRHRGRRLYPQRGCTRL